MSTQLTYEGVLEMIRESNRKSDRDFQKIQRLMKKRDAEFDKIRQETALQSKETHKKISALGTRIGEIIEHMLGERIIEKFQALGYGVTHPVRRSR